MEIRNKKIFITGGSGFIGSSLVKRLVDHNKVIVYDTFFRNSLHTLGLKSHHNLTLIKGDVLDLKKLKTSMKKCDIVFHLAAVVGVNEVIVNPIPTVEVNMIGTYNVLKAAIAAGSIERFFNFSTSEVYGSYAYKLEERDDTKMAAVGEARWTYAMSKLAGEHMAHSYYRVHCLPNISIRPFNIYGPGQLMKGAVHVFVSRAIKGEPICIHGDGDQIRSWCYIDDIVDALLLCCKKKKAVGEVFNIGNPRGTITILSLAEKIVELSGSKSKIVFKPKTYVDVELRIPDIEKAKRILGYRPKVDLDDGLKRTIEWYRTQL